MLLRLAMHEDLALHELVELLQPTVDLHLHLIVAKSVVGRLLRTSGHDRARRLQHSHVDLGGILLRLAAECFLLSFLQLLDLFFFLHELAAD